MTVGRDTEFLCRPIGRDPERLEQVVTQDVAGVHGTNVFQLPSVEYSYPSVVVDDLDLTRFTVGLIKS